MKLFHAGAVLWLQRGAGAAKEAGLQIRATCLAVHDPVPQTGTAQTPPKPPNQRTSLRR